MSVGLLLEFSVFVLFLLHYVGCLMLCNSCATMLGTPVFTDEGLQMHAAASSIDVNV
jgi:hypothetical protein